MGDVNHWRNSPEYVVRFMKVHPKNLKAAEDMFRKMIEWRIENDVDTILEDYTPPQEILDFHPGAMLYGLDRDGDPIYVERLGVTDVVHLYKKYGKDEMMKYAIWIREMNTSSAWKKDYEAKHGRLLKQYNVLQDVHGLNRSHLNFKVLSDYGAVVRMDQDNYPEVAKRIFVIRAPSLFRFFWSAMKVFFDKSMVDRMKFCGNQTYKTELMEYLDLEVLPNAMLEEGKGKAAKGFPPKFEGGKVPVYTKV